MLKRGRLLLRLGISLLRFFPCGKKQTELLDVFTNSGKGIEQIEMRLAVKQAMRFKLPVNVDQRFADLLQHADLHRLVINEGAAAPIAPDRAPQNERFLAIRLKSQRFQRGKRRMGLWQAESERNTGLISPLAQQTR